MKYRTIVADPPWEYDRTGLTFEDGESGRFRSHGLPYRTMSVAEIAALPVAEMAAADTRPARSGCTLFLWTTTQYLRAAHDIAEAWKFKPTGVLVWCKPPRGFGMGGTFKNNVEFVVVGRRGSPPRSKGQSSTSWFRWPRSSHSTKPEAFFDLVEQVCTGPYLEMFARRARFGWDYWGDQSLGTAELPEHAA